MSYMFFKGSDAENGICHKGCERMLVRILGGLWTKTCGRLRLVGTRRLIFSASDVFENILDEHLCSEPRRALN